MGIARVVPFVVLLALGFSASAAEGAPGKKLFHVVCFKFKEGATAEQITNIEGAFRALKGKIPEIAEYQGGANVSKENRAKGFNHCSVLTFKSQKDLDTYIAHAEHKAFGKMLGEVMADVFVMDFWEP